jgi:hypothetical protein
VYKRGTINFFGNDLNYLPKYYDHGYDERSQLDGSPWELEDPLAQLLGPRLRVCEDAFPYSNLDRDIASVQKSIEEGNAS